MVKNPLTELYKRDYKAALKDFEANPSEGNENALVQRVLILQTQGVPDDERLYF